MTNSSGPQYSYVYDLYGNRRQQNALQGGYSLSESFDAATNQTTAASGYTYDAAGNMTGDGFHSYSYDAEGNIVAVDARQTASYVYDALHHKIRANDVGYGQTVEHSFDAAGRVSSDYWLQRSATAADTGYIFWDDAHLAFRSGDGHTYFTHQNWVGTDRVHTDLIGATGAVYTSLPFGDGGAVTNENEEYATWAFNSFGDMDFDGDSNTYRAQFRQYNQAQGRWMSPDPYDGSYDITNPQSFNRYAYALNNPLTFVDPLGLEDSTGGGGGCDPSVSNCEPSGGGGGGGGGCPPGDGCDPGSNDPNGPGGALPPGIDIRITTWWSFPEVDLFTPVYSYSPVGYSPFSFSFIGAGTSAPSNPTTPTPVCYQGGCIIPDGPPLPPPTCGGLKKAAAGTALVSATARVTTLFPPAAPVAGPTSILTGFVAAVLGFLGTFQIGCTP